MAMAFVRAQVTKSEMEKVSIAALTASMSTSPPDTGSGVERKTEMAKQTDLKSTQGKSFNLDDELFLGMFPNIVSPMLAACPSLIVGNFLDYSTMTFDIFLSLVDFFITHS